MTSKERFQRVLNFEPVDRLPVIEWAPYWNLTMDRWHGEGIPSDLEDIIRIHKYFGLDPLYRYRLSPRAPSCPGPASHGAGLVSNRDEYLAIKQHLYPEQAFDENHLRELARRQNNGELAVFPAIEGFFWFPRTLFGIEPHLLAFYDQPDLMNEMNEDLLAHNLQVIERFCDICDPVLFVFNEDMSYNHGPMLSRQMFDELIAPFYRRLIPKLLKRGVIPIVDTDGNMHEAIIWYLEVGFQGCLPLERMAGVDVALLRKEHPDLRMIGAFDKTVMHLGEDRMRKEFERLLPVMRQGGFIPGVDHQTPPEVSLEDYRLYVRLLWEYSRRQ